VLKRLLVVVAAVFVGAASAHVEAAPYQGRSLTDALQSLQQQGLTIVFTSQLVRPEMRVDAEPSSTAPRRILDEILAPHGLAIEEGQGGVLVVVAKAAGRSAKASIAGKVLARGSLRGVGGAVVRVAETGQEARAQNDGSFALADLEPGSYTVEASAAGYLEESAGGVVVQPGTARRVDFRLREQPVFHEEIVVQPSRLALLHERPDSSLSFDREDIESLPHLGGDIFRAVSLLPGVAANDVTAQFSVHGGRRDEVRILLDGQELYDAFHLKDYDSALSFISARSLASASLTTGAYPASHGDRMSGVLDLRTVNPQTGRHYLLGLSVLDALASSSGRLENDRGAWLFTVRRGSLDLAADVIGAENPKFWDVLGKAELATNVGSLSAHVLTASDQLELSKISGDGFERLENNYRSDYAWLTHQGSRGERLLVETIGSWANIERRRRGAGLEEDGGFDLRDRRELEVLALTQTWTLPLEPRQTLQGGWEARRYDAFFDYAKDLDSLIILAPFSPPRLTEHEFKGSLRGDHFGLWASDRISLFDRLTAELGVRFDRHTATDDDLLSPRLNLAWRLGERSVLRGAWGRFFQSQRPYELQVEDGENALRPAELAAHWVLGYETLLAANRAGVEAVRVELFRRDIEDPRPRLESLLEPVNIFPETEPDRVRIVPERSTAEGIELLIRGSRGARFDWWLAYSYARAEDRIAGEKVPRALDQPHALTLDLNYRFANQWSLNLAWRYHSGWPTTPVEARRIEEPEDPEDPEEPEEPEEEAKSELVAVFGRLNSERFPPYHRLDLRASRRWDLRTGALTFFVDIQNLYNRRNLAGFDIGLDEEAGVVELEPEDWPGIFPSLGFTWEF
jgi:hypothetical protein